MECVQKFGENSGILRIGEGLIHNFDQPRRYEAQANEIPQIDDSSIQYDILPDAEIKIFHGFYQTGDAKMTRYRRICYRVFESGVTKSFVSRLYRKADL